MINRSLIFYFIGIALLEAKLNDISTCKLADNHSKIIIAGGSITEIIYFINEEKKIVGVDVTSNYPKKAKDLPSIGYVRNLSTEGILSLNPTLVLGEDDMGPPNVIQQIKEIDVDLRIIPEEKNISGIINKIQCVASIIGASEKAQEMINTSLLPSIKELEKIQNYSQIRAKKVMLILSMQGTSPIVAGRGTSGDGFINMIGAQNVFDSFDGWKPVSAESIIAANPEYILLPNRDMHKNSNVNNLKTNPLFKNTIAGLKNNFISEDAMTMLGFGPRSIDSALKIAKKIAD